MQDVGLKAVGRNGKHRQILLFLCNKLCFHICNRDAREIGGTLFIHLPVERGHHPGQDVYKRQVLWPGRGKRQDCDRAE